MEKNRLFRWIFLLALISVFSMLSGCSGKAGSSSSASPSSAPSGSTSGQEKKEDEQVSESGAPAIDYQVLVNKNHPLPEGWEDAVDLVHITNSLGKEISVERSTYAAYLKLHDQLAREGIVVERKPSRIRIDELEILSCELPRVRMRITCSKGTYIRTLCHDIGNRLGCGGCMEQLVRTRVGRFAVEDALTLNEIQSRAEAGKLSEIMLTPDSFFYELPGLSTDSKYDRLLHNGNMIPEEMLLCRDAGKGRVRVYDSEQRFMGVYKYRTDTKAYYPELFFYEP